MDNNSNRRYNDNFRNGSGLDDWHRIAKEKIIREGDAGHRQATNEKEASLPPAQMGIRE
jgi:hypothetical protein